MIEISKQNARLLQPLFEHEQDMIPQAYLQGHMGRGFIDSLANPACGQIIVGDFCAFAGDAAAPAAPAMVKNIPSDFKNPYLLMVPPNKDWEKLIEACFGEKQESFMRFATHHNAQFDPVKLQANISQLPAGYQLTRIDKKIAGQCLQRGDLKYLCIEFDSIDDFLERGIGFCILADGQPVAGASSYTIYNDGIEIEIDTLEDYRRKRFATICASELILECLKRGLYPNWDAANKMSLDLALKLGYSFNYEYAAYNINTSKHAST